MQFILSFADCVFRAVFPTVRVTAFTHRDIHVTSCDNTAAMQARRRTLIEMKLHLDGRTPSWLIGWRCWGDKEVTTSYHVMLQLKCWANDLHGGNLSARC